MHALCLVNSNLNLSLIQDKSIAKNDFVRLQLYDCDCNYSLNPKKFKHAHLIVASVLNIFEVAYWKPLADDDASDWNNTNKPLDEV